MTAAPHEPHHDGSPLYVDVADPSLGDDVRLRLRTPPARPVARVHARANPDHEPSWSPARRVGVDEDGWTWWQAELVIANPRSGYRWLIEYDDGDIVWLSQAGLSSVETRDADDFALVAGNPPPPWMTSAVMYQIFPDRFARSTAADARETPPWAIPAAWDEPLDPVLPGRSRQFYGGDLDGIAEHLDHLEGLGVDLLYLTPFFPAASNHRYDASSFDRVDPLLGGEEALVRLVEAAHARGMRVIGDLTANHSGDRHEWFRAAHRRPDAPESEFYYFLDPGNERYESWLGTPTLPKLDWSSPELRRRFIEGPDSVVGRWLRPPFSLDGWRIDVANMTGRLADTDLNAEVRRTIRKTMTDIAPDTILLAEITNDASEDLTGDAWHGAMTYADFTRPVWAWLSEFDPTPYLDAEGRERTDPWFFGVPVARYPRYRGADVVAAYRRFTAGIPWRTRLGTMHALDTHDTARFLTHAAAGALPVALGLSVTLPGIPVVWMGDEFGLTARDGEDSRTPMPWGTEADAAETLELYRELLALRRRAPVLGDGGLRWLTAGDDAIAFLREGPGECVLVVASRASAGLELPGIDARAAEPLVGRVRLDRAPGGARGTADGPAFAAWRLPGVAAPGWLGS